MICNSEVTIYHNNGLDVNTHTELWQRYNYKKAWVFGGHGASINKGLNDANDVQVRIPYNLNKELDINDFAVGDIIVKGKVELNIQTQLDLKDYDIYHIISLINNDFGRNPHIHIGGK